MDLWCWQLFERLEVNAWVLATSHYILETLLDINLPDINCGIFKHQNFLHPNLTSSYFYPQFILVFSIYDAHELKYGDYVYPDWTNGVGWGITAYVIVIIPLAAIVKIIAAGAFDLEVIQYNSFKTTCNFMEHRKPMVNLKNAHPKTFYFFNYNPIK